MPGVSLARDMRMPNRAPKRFLRLNIGVRTDVPRKTFPATVLDLAVFKLSLHGVDGAKYECDSHNVLCTEVQKVNYLQNVSCSLSV